jgi:hypothetical protein
MFEKQIKVMQDMSFHDEVMKMRLTHPNCFVLSNQTFFISNKKKVSWTFNWSSFHNLRTTIKYLPVTYSDVKEGVGDLLYPDPNRKIFVMLIVTPAREQVEVPTGLKYNDSIIENRALTNDEAFL